MSDFTARDATVYRPYEDEIPWELLFETDPDEARVYASADADYMRVAKYQGEAIAVYVVQALSATRFELCNLVVAQSFRGKGLGRWMLGHAIGLSESKGAREILIRRAPLRGLFLQVGFVAVHEGLLLTLTPE